MNTANIKNLAIAYEALSRCAGAEAHLSGVGSLLADAIDKQHKEQHPKQYIPDADNPNQDDEIPF